MSRRGRRPQPPMHDASTYPHAYVALVVVRRYFGVGQGTLDKWNENGDLPIRLMSGVRRIKLVDIVAFEAKSGVQRAS